MTTHTSLQDSADGWTITDLLPFPETPDVGELTPVFATVTYTDHLPPVGEPVEVHWSLSNPLAYFYGREPGEPYSDVADPTGTAVAFVVCMEAVTVTVTASVGSGPGQTRSVDVPFQKSGTPPLDLDPRVERSPADGLTANVVEATTDNSRAYQIEFSVDALSGAYFINDDQTRSLTYSTPTDRDGHAIARFYAANPCEGLLKAKLYSDAQSTVELNAQELPFEFADYFQLDLALSDPLVDGEGLQTYHAEATVMKNRTPLPNARVRFTLPSVCAASFVSPQEAAKTVVLSTDAKGVARVDFIEPKFDYGTITATVVESPGASQAKEFINGRRKFEVSAPGILSGHFYVDPSKWTIRLSLSEESSSRYTPPTKSSPQISGYGPQLLVQDYNYSFGLNYVPQDSNLIYSENVSELLWNFGSTRGGNIMPSLLIRCGYELDFTKVLLFMVFVRGNVGFQTPDYTQNRYPINSNPQISYSTVALQVTQVWQ